MLYKLQYAGMEFPQSVEMLWKYRPRGEPPFNVFDLGLRPSVPLGCQCREAGRECYNTIACITDEVRLSMKAAARGKKKIAKHTANAAQEMHRISTGTRLWPCAEKFVR
jgi:hypothetical protein